VLSTHFCPEAATGLGFRFIAPHKQRLHIAAARGGTLTMSHSKHMLGAACASADCGGHIGGPAIDRELVLCRRGIAEQPPPSGLDGIPDERSNWTSMCTRILFHLSKSQ